MSDRFYKDIELPDLPLSVAIPAPSTGFIQLVGREGKLSFTDAAGKETILGESGAAAVPTLAAAKFVVPANTQVLFAEEIDLNDQELELDGILVEVN